MSDESHVEDVRPPIVKLEKRPGYVWQGDYTNKSGKLVKGHWRKVATPKAKRGRPRKSERPQFTNRAHATHCYEQLAVPLAYFTAISSEHGFGPKHEAVWACIKAIDDARSFINRFTGGSDVEE